MLAGKCAFFVQDNVGDILVFLRSWKLVHWTPTHSVWDTGANANLAIVEPGSIQHVCVWSPDDRAQRATVLHPITMRL